MPDFPDGPAKPPDLPASPPLSQRTLVKIWAIHAAELEASLSHRLTDYLIPTEIDRLLALKPPQARRNFLVGRGCLRYLLGQVLDYPPSAVPLSYTAQGKPTLASDLSLQFNVSHSGDWVGIALAARPLGLDLEQERPLTDLAGLCDRCLAPEEVQAVQQLPPAGGTRQFLRYWVCKEAYAKGLGLGLGLPFTSVALDLPADAEPPSPTPVAVRRGVAAGWHIYYGQWVPHYHGGLALSLEPGWQPTLALALTTPAKLLASIPQDLAELRRGLGLEFPGEKAADPGSR
ncbi:MAG TPA: 4'-phosphopantetheinyl transferase superfamily protein [Leptolyngbyaceae cyanobacterium M65_K2018_010]|nr:4'-phosphopantetheinyl transferase superfamily protein [Leptolyngbyaceae cyanobacterium M65_K2018_010]